ncbi:outer membrane protein transport protein [Marinomonas sp. A79]|uniref:Outer membrane protein transport protein n=1 Tax=Marinomonas vulgaris TaxID=2823372 RepID=A0ABS5HE60_9GAMM|nr:outer membrane protein transport protein [Marinomonas vulgaris]MBR7889917.1 outer membrane protein transport protein [Marinomonas vulgaris]
MKHSSAVLFKASLVAVSVAAASSAYSAGFALNDHSATASGTALAGAAASTADISFSYWNPALFTNAKETTFYVSGAYVMPSMDVTVNSATDAAAFGGSDISGDGASGDSVNNTLVPSFYFAKPLSDKTVAGISLNVPFGLSGDDDQDWAGRFHATETAVQDIALSFALAHRVNDWASVGASVQVHKAEIVLESAVGSSNSNAGGEGIGRIEAEDTAVGYSFGAMLEPVKGTRVGLGYRSEIDFDFEGDVKYSGVSQLLNGVLQNNRMYQLIDTDISDSVTMPSVITLSFEHELSKKLTLGLSAIRTGWSSLDGLDIDFESDQPNSELTFGFEDQWMYSAGLTYAYSEKLTLRTGIAMDNSPANDEYRSARTPDGDRKWLSVGATYDFNDMTSATFAFTHVKIKDVSVNRTSLDEDDARGTLQTDYSSSANVISVAMNMAF